MKTAMAIFAFALLRAACSVGGEASFTAKPSAAKDGDKVKISFALAGPTDVEVAVLDAQSKTVRHLAAGVLGGQKAPPEPLKAGLAQELVWDGKDDFGKPAVGQFKARVRAGMRVKFGRFLGGAPYNFGGICGLAADEEGNVYVLGFAGVRNQGHMTLRVFDADGGYLREILPFPADLPPGAMKEVARWDEEAKAWRPRNLRNLNPAFYPQPGSDNVYHSPLTLVSASLKNGVLLTDGTRLYSLEPGGAVRGSEFCTRTMWAKEDTSYGRIPGSGGGPVCLAASPDGKHLYESGPFSASNAYGSKPVPNFPPGRVFRMAVDDPKAVMKEFVTVDVSRGNWTKGLGFAFKPRGPVQGIAVDGKGMVYVCDREHERVSIYDPSGRLADEVPVKYPWQVAVHPESGAIYVMQRDAKSYREPFTRLLKFDKPGKDRQPAAVFEFGPAVSLAHMALSAAGGRTVVWVAGAGGLVALADKGASFEERKTRFAPDPDYMADWARLATDYARDEVYFSNGSETFRRSSGASGEGGTLRKAGKPFYGTDLAVGYDGLLYVRTGPSFSGPFERFNRDLEPAPFAGSGTHVLSPHIYNRYGVGNAERGIGVGPDGRSYVSFLYKWVAYGMAGFGPDGKPMKGKYLQGVFPGEKPDLRKKYPPGLDGAIVGPIPQAHGGIRVDLQHNLYLGVLYWPQDAPRPKGRDKDQHYVNTVGSVAKFPAGGGSFTMPKEGAMRADAVEGALAVYPGLAPFSRNDASNTCCVCRAPRFDLDPYGRLILPNALMNNVTVLDNAGNVIIEFGKYGNFDSQHINPDTKAGNAGGSTGSPQGKPTVAVPDIPLAWPTGAGFTEKAFYVVDTYSRRGVRVDLTWEEEETCEVK